MWWYGTDICGGLPVTNGQVFAVVLVLMAACALSYALGRRAQDKPSRLAGYDEGVEHYAQGLWYGLSGTGPRVIEWQTSRQGYAAGLAEGRRISELRAQAPAEHAGHRAGESGTGDREWCERYSPLR